MVTREIELTEEQNRLLEEVAADQRRSVSELIRQGVDVLLRADNEHSLQTLKRRAAALSGRFRSGLQNLSAEHDQYLDESFGH